MQAYYLYSESMLPLASFVILSINIATLRACHLQSFASDAGCIHLYRGFFMRLLQLDREKTISQFNNNRL